MMTELQSEPMGMLDRLKTAGQVIVTGRKPNPLGEAPKDPSRAALVCELTDWIKEERKFWKPIYEKMREEQRFAAGDQWSEDYISKGGCDDPYVGDIVQQLVNRSVAALYAKNPTPDASRLEKMLFEKWDGSDESIRGAMAIVAQAAETPGQVDEIGQPVVNPLVADAAAIVQDYEKGMAEKALMEKLAETAQLLIKHRWKTHKPDFKVLMKQAVTQAVVSRVAFVEVAYRRDMEQSPTADAGTSPTDKAATLQQKLAALEVCDERDSSSLREEIRLLNAAIERDMMTGGNGVTYEGTVYQLVSPTNVIIDRNCTCLWEFLGARRIARQTLMDVADAEKRFGVSLKDCGAVLYGANGAEIAEGGEEQRREDTTGSKVKPKVCIWHLYDKNTQLCYVICDGVKNFLPETAGEPAEPFTPEPGLERFWPLVAITLNQQVIELNDPEHDVTIYPRSHVRLQMPMQEDINKAGEGLREHRTANRPRWAALGTRWIEGDLAKLAAPAQAHDVVRLESINDGEKIADFLQPVPTQPLDAKLYDPSPSLQAAMLATGLQPANLGAQSGGEKATGQAIAEGAKINADQSNVDGVDFALSVLAQATWEMEIQETSEKTVKEICGRGAMWTTLRKGEVQKEIFLEVEAGSSGRPNQALDAQKFKEIAPIAVPWLQQAGIPLDVLIKEAFRILGVKVDVDDLLRKGRPGMQPQGPTGPMPLAGQAAGHQRPGIPAGAAAPNVAAGGVPGAPPLPPAQQRQMATSAVN